MTVALELSDVAKTFTMHLQGGVRLPVCRGRQLLGARRRMRRARRAVRRRQVVDPQDDLRQLSLRPRPDCRASGRTTDVDMASAAPRHILGLRSTPSAMSASFCVRFRGCRPSMSWPSRWSLSGVPGTRRAKAPNAAPSQYSRRGCGPAAGDLFRRRAAARQHRPRLPARPADPAARRADRLARRRSTRAVVMDMIAERKRRGAAIVAIVHDDPMSATGSPTPSSMSLTSPTRHEGAMSEIKNAAVS